MFYSVGEKAIMIKSYIYTKIFWKNARLIRLPFYARNRRNIVIQKGFTCGFACRITAGKK